MSLDDAYANAPYIEGAESFPPRWAAEAAEFRSKTRAELDLAYGDKPRQRLDLFLPDGTAKGLMVFVHGGYWKAFDKSSWSHLAAGALAKGWAVAMPSYSLAPEARVAEITDEIAAAIQFAARKLEGPIALTGHSAGGHLVARMCMEGVLPAEVASRISAVVPISPVSDLRPLLETEMNGIFRLDAEEAEAESPALASPSLSVPVTVWVGAEERPAFLDQARWLAEAWSCGHVVAEGRHHFDVIDALTDADSALCRTLLNAA